MARTEQDHEVAETILAQLGGLRRLNVMLGVKYANTLQNGLSLGFTAQGEGQINQIDILLEPSDTYRIEFYRVRGGRAVLKETYVAIYADSLKEAIKRATGLNLSL